MAHQFLAQGSETSVLMLTNLQSLFDNTRVERCSRAEYILIVFLTSILCYFTHLIFIHWRFKSINTKLMTLNMTLHSQIFICISLNIHHVKVFQIKVVYL